MSERTNERASERTNERTNEQTNERTNERSKEGTTVTGGGGGHGVRLDGRVVCYGWTDCTDCRKRTDRNQATVTVRVSEVKAVN